MKASEALHVFKMYCIIFFIMWLVTFIACICSVVYSIKLHNDIGTEVITEETETYDMDAENGINNVIGGDNNGTNEIHQN